MNILHYSLGYPPFRTGGMTKYCMDLMTQQKNDGHSVSLLWPGRYSLLDHDSRIKDRIKYHYSNDILLGSYELINPMPVPLLEGVCDFDLYTKPINIKGMDDFFRKNKIDVLHLHTLMGIPYEVVAAAKNQGTKIIFTTHDYYGLCPKCNFMYGNTGCPSPDTCLYCGRCNDTALSLKKIKILQSGYYRLIKKTGIVKKLRKGHISALMDKYSTQTIDERDADTGIAQKYIELRQYYTNILNLCDWIHCNSTNTRSIFEKFIASDITRVISITNKEISDKKRIKDYRKAHLRIGYLGPASVRKGFFKLLECLDTVYETIKDFSLIVYNSVSNREYIVANEPYSYDQIEEVMNGIDVLIVPSICKETFGFTVLEAYSYGVPVIVSENVGAKDLVKNGSTGFIYTSDEELIRFIKEIVEDRGILSRMNVKINQEVHIKTMKEHSEEMIKLYSL